MKNKRDMPIAVCATSDSCWHCGKLRKFCYPPVNEVVPETNDEKCEMKFVGKWEWAAPIFRSLIYAAKKYNVKNNNRVLVIHFESASSVTEIDEYALLSGGSFKVVRKAIARGKGDCINQLPPIFEMNTFVPMFPGWFFVDDTVWENAVNRVAPLMAVVPGFETVVTSSPSPSSLGEEGGEEGGGGGGGGMTTFFLRQIAPPNQQDPVDAFAKFVVCPQTRVLNGSIYSDVPKQSIYSMKENKNATADGFSFVPAGRMTAAREMCRRSR